MACATRTAHLVDFVEPLPYMEILVQRKGSCALQGRLLDADVDAGTKVLVVKSGGVFIYARYAVVERLQMQKHVTLAELDDFPDGLADFYGDQFKRMLEVPQLMHAPVEPPPAIDSFDVYVGQSTVTMLVETLFHSVVVENHLCV